MTIRIHLDDSFQRPRHTIYLNQGDITELYEISPFNADEATANLSDAGWTCRSIITNMDGDLIADNTITSKSADDLAFNCQIGPADTDILDIKQYKWIIQIQNLTATPNFRKEYHFIVAVGQESAIDAGDTYTEYAITTIGTASESYEDRDIIVTPDHTAPGTTRYIELRDNTDTVIQRVGHVSTATVGGVAEVTLLEPAGKRYTPTKLVYVST